MIRIQKLEEALREIGQKSKEPEIYDIAWKALEEESICDKCVEVCKATHPRAVCPLVKLKLERVEPLKGDWVTDSEHRMKMDAKINEIIRDNKALWEALNSLEERMGK